MRQIGSDTQCPICPGLNVTKDLLHNRTKKPKKPKRPLVIWIKFPWGKCRGVLGDQGGKRHVALETIVRPFEKAVVNCGLAAWLPLLSQ